MTDDETSLTPDEARKRFGELLHGSTRTHMQFDGPDGGVWRPRFDADLTLLEYRLYRPVRGPKKVRPAWRPKGK